MKFKETVRAILDAMPDSEDQELVFTPVAGMLLICGPLHSNPMEGGTASFIKCDPGNTQTFRDVIEVVVEARLSGAALDSEQKRLN